jgi:hypothetical protein
VCARAVWRQFLGGFPCGCETIPKKLLARPKYSCVSVGLDLDLDLDRSISVVLA